MYHYCSEETFSNIIKSKKLWLTPVETMKDSAEIKHLYKNVWNKAKSLLLDKYSGDDWAIQIIKIVDDHTNTIAIQTDMPFCCCLSNDGDLLQQWRFYADDGKGFSLCFDSELLNVKNSLPHPNTRIGNAIGVGNVIYGFSQQVNILFSIVGQILDQRQNSAVDWVTIITNLRYFSAIFKNSTFYTEQERRIIYYYSDRHEFNDSFVSGPYDYLTDQKRFELNWYSSNLEHGLRRIILGPKNAYSNEEVINLLAQNGIDVGEENILKSISTYR